MGSLADWGGRAARVLTISLADLNPLRREETYAAVDIGSSSIKLLEVRTGPSGLQLMNWGSAPTPPSAIQNHMVTEPGRVGETIKGLVEAQRIRARKAITAVPGPAVMIKRVSLPAHTEHDIENTILLEAGNFIPEDLENVNLDYQVIGKNAEAKEVEVLLAAAKRDIVSSYAETLRAAGLLPVVVDVDYFALDNLYELNYDPVADQVVALVNIGARYSSINILKGGRSVFTGDVPVGGRDITEALTRDLGVPAEEAERLKVSGGGGRAEGENVDTALGPAIDALIEEIHYALSFFWTAATDERIDLLYLSGGAAQTRDLARRLSERIEAPVEVIDPFSRTALLPAVDAAALQQRGAEFAIALGMSIRRPGDK
ncbi:MAG: type IV pilus assembly protein PilM [Candidatus Binatia bacterium]